MITENVQEKRSTKKDWQSAIEDLSSRVFGRKDAFTLSKAEMARLEYESRAEKSSQEAADRGQFNEEEKAIAQGMSITGTGRRIYRHGRAPQDAKAERERKEKNDVVLLMVGASSIAETIKHMGDVIGEVAQNLRHSFAPTARQTNKVCTSADKEFIFDDVPLAVTFATQAQVEKDAEILKAEYEKLEAMSANIETLEPGVRARQALKLLNLSDEFDMRRHPESKAWVPSEIRVKELEHEHNPHGTMECKGLVCVFRPKAAIAHDSMGIKSKVGDVLDQNPEEAVRSGQHLSTAVKTGQAPAPSGP